MNDLLKDEDIWGAATAPESPTLSDADIWGGPAAPAAGEQNVLSDADIWGDSTTPAMPQSGYRKEAGPLYDADNPPYAEDQFIKAKKVVNGKEYRLHGPTGVIYDENNRAVVAPDVLKAFGRDKPNKLAQSIYDANQATPTAPSVPDRKIIDGREYRLGKDSGIVFDDKNKIVDDPQIRQAFGIDDVPGVGDYAAELGKSTVRGVAGAASSAGKGLGVLTSDNAAEIARVEEGIANLKSMTAEEATAFMRELPSKLSPAVAFNYQVAIRKLWRDDVEGAKPYLEQARKYIDTRPVEEQGLTVAGKQLEEATNEAFPQDPRFKGSITSDIGQAAGSSLFFLPIGLLTGGTGVAVAGAAAGAAESYDTAKGDIQNGNFRDDRGGLFNAGYGTAAETAALGAGRLGALPGASEVVPTEIFLEQMPKYIPGLRTIANTPAWGRFAKAFGRVGTQVLSEGGQEAFQTWAGNLINQLKINPSQDITEDVLYNALLGGIVGGGMQTGVEGYNAVFGKDAPAATNGGPVNVSPQAPQPGQRIDPTLFPNQQAAPQPGAPPAEAPTSDDAWLMGAGYTPEQIDDMNPEERAAAVEEAQAQGVEPVDLMAGAPAPGTAPMAPRGTRRDRVNVQSEQDLEQVRPTVNAEPSPAQAAAGNYQKGHIKIHGFDVSIENPKGSLRRGTDEDGVEWQSPRLPADYGYIKGTTGKDGDHVDVYIGPNPESDRVFVIDQLNPKTGEFDEHKAVMGADSIYHAEELYSGSFTNPTDDQWQHLRRIGAITEMSADEFRDWVNKGRNTKRPASDAGVGIVTAGALKRPTAATVGDVQNAHTPEPTPAADDDFDSIFQQELDAEYGPSAPAPAAAPQLPAKPRNRGPINVLDFIASIGGISDPTGELAGMDLPRMTKFGPVLRKTGLHPDKVREALVEAGLLYDRGRGTDLQAETTENDVYDLIARHMGGDKVYTPQDQAKADANATTRAAEAQNPELENAHPIALRWGDDVHAQVQQALAEMGMDEDAWSPQEVNDAARMISEGMDPEQAFERAYATHVAELEDMPEIAPEIAAAFEKNRANAMVVFDPPPFPDVETADNAAQQQDLPEAGDGLVADGEAGPDARGEAEIRGAGPESAGARPDGAEAGSQEFDAGQDDLDPEEARQQRVAEHEDFQSNYQSRIEKESLPDPKRPHAIAWAEISTLEVEPGQFTASYSVNFPTEGKNGLPGLHGVRYASKAEAQAAMAQKIIDTASKKNGKQAQMIREWAAKYYAAPKRPDTRADDYVLPDDPNEDFGIVLNDNTITQYDGDPWVNVKVDTLRHYAKTYGVEVKGRRRADIIADMKAAGAKPRQSGSIIASDIYPGEIGEKLRFSGSNAVGAKIDPKPELVEKFRDALTAHPEAIKDRGYRDDESDQHWQFSISLDYDGETYEMSLANYGIDGITANSLSSKKDGSTGKLTGGTASTKHYERFIKEFLAKYPPEKAAPAAEKGADAKEQLVIPGAERDQKGALNNAAKAPLKGSVPQKGMDVGLFGSERDQTDMFDKPAPKKAEEPAAESFDDVFGEELDAEFGKPKKADLQGNWWEPLMGGEEKPKKKAKTAGEAAKSAAKNTAKGMGEIVQGLEALFGNKNKLSSGFTFDEESYAKALPLFKAAVTHLGEAVKDMREVVRALIKKFREAGMSREALEAMQPYLKRFAEDVTAGKVSLEEQTDDEPALSPFANSENASPFHPLVQAFVDYLSQPDAAFDTITEARKFAKDRGFDAKPGTPEAKDLDEKLELAIVLTARTLVGASKKRPPVTAYRRLVDLYNRQPNLGVRTSESMADQAYSTPAPLAFIASRLAGVAGAKSVMEPTAGNGMLLIEASPSKADVNELNDRRREALKAQGFRASGKDAATENLRHKGYPVEAIIANPPFGAVRDTDGGSKTFTVDGWNTTQIDHAIALNTLKSLADTGRAVLIVGSVKEGTDKTRSDAYNTKQKREFYWRLYQGYNVVDHFTVAGDLYKRQGAGWPVDVIVIEGRGKSARPLPAVELPKFYDTWEALEEKLNEAPAQTDTGTGQEAGGAAVSGPAGLRDGAENAPRVEAGSRGNRPAADVGGAARLNPEARGQAPVSDGSNLGEPAGLGEQQSREPDGGEVSPGARDERDGDRQPAAAPRERVKQEAGAAQQTYKPMSGLKALDTNIPTNMADAVEQSLKALAEEHGDLDRWIEKELGYKKGELGQYLAAEQVDAVALAIHNVKKNAAFIIGDQTGIGKGRVVASALRYAMRNRLVPIFVTEKPNLYGDIIRDLNDIGVPQMLGRDLKPFLTNAGASIPLDDEAVAWYDEAERAKVAGNPAPEKRGKFLRASGGDLHKRQMAALQKDGTGKDFDIIFTTYDQLNTVKGQPTDRRRLVEGLADRSFMVLDESHNAGGTEASERAAKNAPESRSDFLKKMTGKAKAVMFSSATYAKRPGVMALYARTDMGKAVEKPEMLGALIERGGVPMQQVVAAMLAKAGQYIRRERSFDGVSYDVEPVTVDLKAYEAVSTSLSAIAQFDMALKKGDTFKEIKENLKESAEAAAMDSGTGSASVSSTNFTSLMHNIVNQMLLAIKTDAVASRAIEALKAGEKPVITVANTMGAFLKTYAEENELKRGDAVDLSFRDVLSRYLERTRRLTIKRPDNTTYHYMIPLSALPGDLLSAYREAERLIGTIDTANLPISPIDWLRHRIQKAGYRVSEITGRKEILEYGGPDNATFAQRLDSEVSPAGRRVNIDKFNRGDLDVMILNRAGSTGLSLHASSKFKDQRRRRMIIAQAELNIDVHMQMLGRVHRTGQVIPPAFVQAYADVPAEARPAAVLAKKMASLNANTTASRKSAFSADDSVDFLNEYGDQIAREYLVENPGINELLDVSLDPEKETARELTGRLLLLPVAQQRAALDDITARYKVLIENLDAMGENALEAKTIDLEAKTVSRQDLKPAEGDSPFTQAVVLEQTEVKAQGKALPLSEIIEKAAEALGAGKVSAENPESALNELERVGRASKAAHYKKWYDDFDRMAADEIKVTKNEDLKTKRREALNENRYRFTRITDLLMAGRRIVVKAKDGSPLTGIVMKVSRRGQTGVTGNPLALGAWSAEIAIPDNAQRITVPFSSLALPGDTVGEAERKVFVEEPDWANGVKQTVEAFENARKTGKETRYIVTGNILAGFDQTKGQGQIINYTDDQGNVKPGILMSKTFSPKAFLESRAVRFKTAAQVLAFLDKLPDAEIMSHDDIITVRKTGAWVEVEMPAARQSGGTYFLNPDVRKAASDQFTKVGSRMRYKTNLPESANKVLDAMMTAGAVFQTTEQQDVAEEIITGKKPEARKQAPLSSRAQGRLSSAKAKPVFYSGLLRAVEGLKLETAPKAQWMGSIRNTPGVKPEEIAWIGLEGWLAEQSGQITKKQLTDFIKANQVEVQEVVKERKTVSSYRSANDYRDELWELSDQALGDAYAMEFGFDPEDARQQAIDDRDTVMDELVEAYEQSLGGRGADDRGETTFDTTKFSKYQLPGGENYREILLTLPEKDGGFDPAKVQIKRKRSSTTQASAEVIYDGKSMGIFDDPPMLNPETRIYETRPDEWWIDVAKRRFGGSRDLGIKPMDEGKTYRSSHFEEPNILAHVRFNERMVDGKRVLFIEEIQSDWHQTGRKKGYKLALSKEEGEALVEERRRLLRANDPRSARYDELTSAEREQNAARIEEINQRIAQSNGVPDAPFKTTWPELAMKRMVRWAAENGFDRIAWTPGEVQAERYDLSKQVSDIEVEPVFGTDKDGAPKTTFRLSARDTRGLTIIDDKKIKDADEAADYVGKEVAAKLFGGRNAERLAAGKNAILGGLDLKVGGAGMKGFYDKILVDVANKLGKKWGAKVGQTSIHTGNGDLSVKRHHDISSRTWSQMSEHERNVLRNEYERDFGQAVHSLDIPAEMKAAAMEGQPLFKRQQPEAQTQRPENPYRFVISAKQRVQITREITQIAERILGHRLARVEIVTNQAEWDETFSPEEDAVYDPNTGIIYLALHGSQDLRSTLRHEAVHALRQAGVITAQEWAVLSRMAQTRWIDQYGIRDRYETFYRERFDITEAELEQILIEEAIADAMADSWGKAPAEDVVSRIFARIKAFLEAVRNALRGQGFTTASQIITGIEQGSMARRRPGTGQGRDILLYARQSEQAPLSSRRRLSPPQNPTPGSFEAPHDERVLRALTDSTDSLLNRLKRAGRAFGTEFRRKAQDREIDLLRTQNAIEQANGGPLAEPRNAYLAASLYPGRVAQRDKDLVDDVIEPLVKDIARRGLSLEEVNDFVMARHAIERNLEVGQLHKPGSQFHEAMTNPAIVGASGMSENEANDILNDAQASGKFADLEAVGDEIVAMNRRTLAKLYAEGLITQEQYDALTQKYQYYVPLRGWDDVTDDSHPDTPKTGRRYDVRGPEFQQALGRTSKADSPLAYSIMQARQAVIRIEKNRVGKRFLRLAQANPNAAFWEVNRVDLKRIVDPKTGFVRNIFDRGATEAENVYAVKVGGKRYNITLHHEGLLRAMKGIGGENMGDLVGVFHKINRFFAMMNTQLDPEFIFRNFLRDIQQAGIVIQEEKAKGLTRKIIAAIPKAAYGMNQMLQGKVTSQWARYAREFADAGGKIGFMDRADIELEKRNLERLMKEATAGWTARTLRAANEQTLERLARYNDSIENTLRLSTYVALRQAGATKDRAAFVARELTVNFNRKGEWGPALNAFYLFYNASMQGAASLFMRLGRSRKMKMVAAGLIVEAFLMDMLNRMIGGDDDDDKNRYDKIPQEEKARNHIFMMPKWFEEKYGTPYYKVPLPLGWNWFNVIGQQASSAVAGAVTPLEAFGTIAGTFADSFNPLGSGDFLSTVTPTLLDPLLEIARNKDFFGENITPRQFDETTPNSERYKPNVNPAAKWLTDTFSSLTGGSPERSGAVDISPEWVEHLTDFAFGGLGRFFTRSFNTVENWTSGEELDAGKIPFRRVFIGRDSTFADRDEYFQIRDAVHVTEKELRARIAEKNPQAAAEVRRKYGREIKMMNLLDAAEKQLAKLRKDYKAVKNSQRMGEEARAKRLEALTQRMDEIQRKVRTKWHQLGEDVETSPSSGTR